VPPQSSRRRIAWRATSGLASTTRRQGALDWILKRLLAPTDRMHTITSLVTVTTCSRLRAGVWSSARSELSSPPITLTGLRDIPFRRPYGPGWALVRDAGHPKDPLHTRGGIRDAFRDVELLVEALDAGHCRRTPGTGRSLRGDAHRDGHARRIRVSGTGADEAPPGRAGRAGPPGSPSPTTTPGFPSNHDEAERGSNEAGPVSASSNHAHHLARSASSSMPPSAAWASAPPTRRRYTVS